MSRQIFIQEKEGVIDFAVLEDGILSEIHSQKSVGSLVEGDIYLGKVVKFLLGINSAFVDIGEKKNGFLHYSDLSPMVLSWLDFTKKLFLRPPKVSADLQNFKTLPLTQKDGKINQVLSRNDFLLVQVSKEPISTKGARLTTDISIAGRFLVLVPFSTKGISISKKIVNEKERKRLSKIVEHYKHPLFTIILRTAAQGAKSSEIVQDIKNVTSIWKTLIENVKEKGASIKKVHNEDQRIISFLRDYLSDDYDQIVINTKSTYLSVVNYLKKINSAKHSIVEYAEQDNLFDQYNITKQIRSAFSAKVPLKSGGHLIIEKTEAMHVIDVNSGFKVFSEEQDKNAFENNLLAAKEICRQIKLRDLGGIIVIDFIDMKALDYRKQIYEFVRESLTSQRSSSKILPITKFGIMQITRQRVRPEVVINTSEKCPSCKGSGKLDSHSVNIEDELFKTIDYLFNLGHKKITIQLNPIIFAYITKGGLLFSTLSKWKWKFKKSIKLEKVESMPLTMYKFFDHKSEEILLN